MAADTTLMPPPRDRRTGATSSQVRNTAIHPDQRPTSSQEIGTPAGFGHGLGHGRRLTWTTLAAFGGIVLLAVNLRSAVTAVPPLLDRITADLGFNATVIGVLGSFPALAFSAAGLVGVRLLRRFSAERIAVGILLVECDVSVGTGRLCLTWVGQLICWGHHR